MRPKIPIRPNFYSGGRVNRADRLRRDPVALAEALAHPEALILPVWRNRHLVTQDLKPIRLIRRELENGIVDEHQVVFLGLEENRGVFALDLSPHETVKQHPAVAKRGEFRDLREFGPLLPAEEGALLAYARALLYWHQRHLFCGLL